MRPTIVRVPAERENGLCFPVQTRRALPSKRAEGSPEKPLINQARPAEGTLSPYPSASPGPIVISDPKLNTSRLHSESMLPSGISAESN